MDEKLHNPAEVKNKSHGFGETLTELESIPFIMRFKRLVNFFCAAEVRA